VEGTDILWDEWRHQLMLARFSYIAASLLVEEMPKIKDRADLKDFQKRFNRHIRACEKHVRQAEKIRRQIERLERKRKA